MFGCLEALLFEADDEELLDVNEDVEDADEDEEDDDLVLGGVKASAFGESDLDDEAEEDDEAMLPTSWLWL